MFQRRNRHSSHVNFNRNWSDYSQGFGNVSGNFWLGLNTVHHLCNVSRPCQLRVDIKAGGRAKFAQYETFYISGEAEFFSLYVANYSGDAGMDELNVPGSSGDALNGMAFSTRDKDNDLSNRGSCAKSYQSGWWFHDCFRANLNLPWDSLAKDQFWHPFTNHKQTQLTEMKIRPRL